MFETLAWKAGMMEKWKAGKMESWKNGIEE
jgi:hypothetical protein